MPLIEYLMTDVRRTPATGPVRAGKWDMRVSWVEDSVRGFDLTMPEEDYTPSKGIAAVEAEVQKHSQIIGTKRTVGG